MTPEEWKKIRPILEGALELAPALRTQYLEDACSDPAVRQEIESLIRSHEQASTDLLNAPAVTEFPVFETRFAFRKGKRIGAYEIVEEIAQGGMGAVYLARRADGQYKQQVALKLVRADLSTPTAASRFRNERQILASLDHPNIAKILDGGSTGDGLPYLVMEYINGQPITEYCDQHKLALPERLKLFQAVCSAVHYAHQHLVIHRDIKPNNILVTAEGIPKLLDFGIAKILDPGMAPEESTLTGGQWLMTPEYASPEQLRGETITTATDIYSLGLVLYQLLTGHHAYYFPSRAPHEVARVILESDPEKPSTVVVRKQETGKTGGMKGVMTPELVSSLRGDSTEKLQRRLTGDLDNIVMKAIRKSPGERYNSADQFSDDIRRHLEGRPVLARQATVAYRVQKYVLRHKVGVSFAVLFVGCVIAAMILIVREARIARANELRAERRFNDVRALAGSLIFEVHDSVAGLQGSTDTRKLILERAQQYLDGLTPDSGNDPDLLRELAAAYSRLASVEGDPRDASLGVRSQAEANYRKALQLRQQALRERPGDLTVKREVALDQLNLAVATSDKKESQACREEALREFTQLAAAYPQDKNVLAGLAKAYELNGGSRTGGINLSPALEYYEKSLEIRERLAKEDPAVEQNQVELSFALKHVGAVLAQQGRLDEALQDYQRGLAIDEAQLAAHPDNPNARYFITYTYSDIGFVLGRMGRLDEALSYYWKALEIRAAMAAASPHDSRAQTGMANTDAYIAGLLRRKGNLAGAAASLNKDLAIREALLKQNPSDEVLQLGVALAQSYLAELYAEMAAKHAPREKQIEDCREALRWEDMAMPVFEKLQREGKLSGSDAQTLADLQKAMEKCKAVAKQ